MKKNTSLKTTIEKKVKQHGSPLMLVSKKVLERQVAQFRKMLPRVKIYYSVKANPHPEIIKVFKRLGTGFDCASGQEIRQVKSLGVSVSKMLFANTVKQVSCLKTAKRHGVKSMTFDNEGEIEKIAKIYPEADLILRLKVVNSDSQVALSLKFGVDPDKAIDLLLRARDRGLKARGLSFHVGSQCINVQNFLSSLDTCAEIFEAAREQGIELDLLDIGGGFPIRHFKSDEHPDFAELAEQIAPAIDRHFPADVEIIAEPGRYLVGESGTLVSSVIGKSIRNDMNYYYLDDGVYQDFSGVVFDHCKYEYQTLKRGKKWYSALAGPTCDSFDTIALNELLPKLDIGDLIFVNNIGAYSHSSAGHFNGFPPAKVVLI